MTNQLVQLLHQTEVNRIILTTIAKQDGKIGRFVADGIDSLTPEIVQYMKQITEDMCVALKALNEVFIEKNITGESSTDYVSFLCELLPQYLDLPSNDEVKAMTPHEIEALVNATAANTTIEEQREGLVENLFLNQNTPDKLTISAIRLQFEVIDDGTIQEAFKTLLMKQYNLAVNTPAII